MDIFRKHITQWIAGSLLIVGMGMHVVLPYSNTAKKTSFAHWLDGNVVSDGTENESLIRNHIKNLPLQSNSFGHFLKKASHLVAANQNDFKLPPGSGEHESANLSQWLFKQWTAHLDIHADQNSILPDNPRPLSNWLIQNYRIFSGVISETGFANQVRELFPVDVIVNFRILPTPFLSGITINAP